MRISVLKTIPTSAIVVVLSLLGTLTLQADPGVFDDRIVFGQSAALKGPAAALGLGMREGILAAFHEANTAGGIHGRKLELISYNDDYEPEVAIAKTNKLIDEDRVFALIGEVGTPTSKAVQPITTEQGVPFIGPFTGADFLRESGYTTQIGSDRFTVFRTGPSKSRQAFLSRLCGSTALYVIHDEALDYMKGRQLPQIIIDKFADHEERIFPRHEDWERHLQALGLTDLKVTPDPVLIASEGALWGAIRHQGLLADTVIVSDD